MSGADRAARPDRDGGPLHRAAPPRRRASVGTRLAVLGLAATAVDLGSVYIKAPAAPSGVTLGDWISGIGAYLLIALYAWVASGIGARRGARATLFLAAIITYAFGNGIHLAANSIHDMLDKTGGSDPWKLAYFWDETAGHYLVDAARIAFAVSLTRIEWCAGSGALRGVEGAPSGGGAALAPVSSAGHRSLALALGAVSYGFIYFATAVEGQTVPLALPYSILFAVWGLARARSREGGNTAPVRGFYTAAALTSIVLFAIWGVWHRGFPEFSRTGFIP